MNCHMIARALLAAVALMSSAVVLAASPNDEGASTPTMEVQVLSFTANEQQRARAVVQPCALDESCNKVEVIIDDSTELLDNGKLVSVEEAAELSWKFAVINLSPSNKAKLFVRVPTLH